VTETGTHTSLLVGEFLTATAQQAQPGPVAVGDFGIEVQPLNDALRRATGATRGVLVGSVRPDGRAAGILQPADVILSVQETPVDSPEGFRQAERNRGGAAEVSLSITRGGKPLEIILPAPVRGPAANHSIAGPGIVGRSVTNTGIEVVTVAPGSSADAADVRRGDLVVLLNGQSSPTVAMLDRAYRAAKPGEFILLGVVRDQRQRLVALEKR
jgi:S1-C subfamily serine protease